MDYLDTSAFLKLIRSEPESPALRAELVGAQLVSSALLTLEGRRAAARYGALALQRARLALTTVTLLAIDQPTLDAAASLDSLELRSLDALHLASALSLGQLLGRLFCYDPRLGRAARAAGIDVRAPV